MADISNITVNEVNYDLKDTSARNSISTLESNLSKLVPLTKAQYDALGDKVLTDGVYYFITDVE